MRLFLAALFGVAVVISSWPRPKPAMDAAAAGISMAGPAVPWVAAVAMDQDTDRLKAIISLNIALPAVAFLRPPAGNAHA